MWLDMTSLRIGWMKGSSARLLIMSGRSRVMGLLTLQLSVELMARKELRRMLVRSFSITMMWLSNGWAMSIGDGTMMQMGACVSCRQGMWMKRTL